METYTISMAIFNSYVKLPEGNPSKVKVSLIHENSIQGGLIPILMEIDRGIILRYSRDNYWIMIGFTLRCQTWRAGAMGNILN